MARGGTYVPNNGYFAEMAKFPQVKEALLAASEKMADGANAHAASVLERSMGIDELKVPPYAAEVKDLAMTSIGVAYAKTSLGVLAERIGKSLSAQNH
ncbi:MAG: hypothetical protein Q4B35_06445 [Slackia sp.]|nr:hypothetical protein [Slackia sp.]